MGTCTLTMSNSELACVYAALILADDDVAITAEKLSTIMKAAGVDFEPYWPGLFAKALESCDLKELITNVGSGVGALALLAELLLLEEPLLQQRRRRKKRRRNPKKRRMMTWALVSLTRLSSQSKS